MLLISFFGYVYLFEVGCELTRAVVAWLYGAEIKKFKWYPHKLHERVYAVRATWDWNGYKTREALQMVYFSPIAILTPALLLFAYLGTWSSFSLFSASVVVFLHELWSGQLIRLRVFPKSVAAIVTLSVLVLSILALGLVLC